MTLCACGCGGTPNKPNSKWMQGHNPHPIMRGKDNRMYGRCGPLSPNFGKHRTPDQLKKMGKWRIGKKYPHTAATKEKMSKTRRGKPHPWQVGRPYPETARIKQRITVAKQIKEYRGNAPENVGRFEKQILDEAETLYQIKIERSYPILGYWLDGYIPSLKIAFEIDERHHFKPDGTLRDKDIRRQSEIEKELGCQFIRIDDTHLRNP